MAVARMIPMMSVEEFQNWNSPGGYLWQLVDGEPVAMAPPAPLHGVIQNEAGRVIANHLMQRGSACTVISTPGVIPGFQADRNFLIPDLAVTCSSADITGKAVLAPALLIEILSPSNHMETWRNIPRYMTIPSLREILVIRTASMGVDLLCRAGNDAWPDKPLTLSEGMLKLSSIGLSLPLAALYRGTGMAA